MRCGARSDGRSGKGWFGRVWPFLEEVRRGRGEVGEGGCGVV